MIELVTDGQTHIVLRLDDEGVALTCYGPLAPSINPIPLTLPDVENLQKALGKMADNLRGKAAKA